MTIEELKKHFVEYQELEVLTVKQQIRIQQLEATVKELQTILLSLPYVKVNSKAHGGLSLDELP